MASIDIGPGATDRASTYPAAYTFLFKDNPANDTGIINSIELWFNTNATGVKVGTFYEDGGAGKYTCRASHTIGDVTAGSKQTFPGLSIDVVTGDLIGIYWATGNIEYQPTGAGGAWYDTDGDTFGVAQNQYTSVADLAMSVYGEGGGEIHEGEVSIAAVASLSITGNRLASAVAAIETVPSLTGTPLRIRPGACSIATIASLLAEATKWLPAEVAITVSAALTAAANLIASGEAEIDVTSSLVADADVILSALAAIESTASLTATSMRIRPGAVEVDVTPSLVALGNLIADGVVDIDAVSSMVIDGDLVASAVASLEAIASLAATPLRIRPGVATIEAVPSLSIDGNFIAAGMATIQVIASLIATATKRQFATCLIGVVASLLAASTRIRPGEVSITAVTSLEAAALAYIAQCMGYTGQLSSGDVLVINVDEMTVELNGANATKYFTGTFPLLYVGENIVRWKDDDEDRDVALEVKHRPRYL